LAEIAENRRQRQELVERIAELDAQLEGPAGLIAQAFEAGPYGAADRGRRGSVQAARLPNPRRPAMSR
jgi:hypothetical protein